MDQPEYPNNAQKPNNNEEAILHIQKQIEFYFSDANLITDRNLYKKIKQSHRSWVPITYLFQCYRIRQIFKQHQIGLRARRKKIAKAVKNSDKLKVRDWKVKRKQPFRLKREKGKMVYFETSKEQSVLNTIATIEQFCQSQGIEYSVKKNQNWVMFVAGTEEQGKELERFIRIKGDSLDLVRILNGSEWNEEEKRFEILRNKLKEHIKNTKK